MTSSLLLASLCKTLISKNRKNTHTQRIIKEMHLKVIRPEVPGRRGSEVRTVTWSNRHKVAESKQIIRTSSAAVFLLSLRRPVGDRAADLNPPTAAAPISSVYIYTFAESHGHSYITLDWSGSRLARSGANEL